MHEIQQIAHHTLEGHQRSIMGKMTVEEILQNKQKFGEEVFEIATVGMSDYCHFSLYQPVITR